MDLHQELVGDFNDVNDFKTFIESIWVGTKRAFINNCKLNLIQQHTKIKDH